MTDRTHRYLNFLTIVLHEDRLYGVSLEKGELYPLYVYGPLQHAIDNDAPPPLSKGWPDYARKFVSQYVPLPVILTNLGALIAEHLPEFSPSAKLLERLPELLLPRHIRDDLSFQTRPDDTYSWPQTTFRFWPLYYVGPGMFADESSDHPVMFQPATLALPWLSAPDSTQPNEGENLTFPPPGLGP